MGGRFGVDGGFWGFDGVGLGFDGVGLRVDWVEGLLQVGLGASTAMLLSRS